jgi:hypothetical protein
MQKPCMGRLLESPKAQNISVHRRRNPGTQDFIQPVKIRRSHLLANLLTVTEVDVLRAIFLAPVLFQWWQGPKEATSGRNLIEKQGHDLSKGRYLGSCTVWSIKFIYSVLVVMILLKLERVTFFG